MTTTRGRAVPRPDKVDAVDALTVQLQQSTASVLTEYRGLTVGQLRSLRRDLAGHATFAVVKNTLGTQAATAAGVGELGSLLHGPSAIAFVTGDPVVAAKALRAFAGDHPALVIKGGVYAGQVVDAATIGRLADLESREATLSRLAGALKGSLAQAAGLFNAPLSKGARTFAALQASRAEAA